MSKKLLLILALVTPLAGCPKDTNPGGTVVVSAPGTTTLIVLVVGLLVVRNCRNKK